MKHLLYYPSFEVRSENWLKFALLYLDELHPIIPLSGESHLSDFFSAIRDETDLIKPDRPNYDEGMSATLDAVELIQKMLSKPGRYREAIRDPEFLTNWRLPDNHRFNLFSEKYTDSWRRFCLDERLATESDEGLRVSRPLGLVYMSLLAHIISERRGIEPITDLEEMDHISVLTRKVSPFAKKKSTIANHVIQLKLPGNIRELDITKIIAHRESSGFKSRLHAFHSELEKHIKKLENGEANQSFLESRGSIFKEFSDEVASLGVGVAGFSLGMWLLMSKPTSASEFTKEVLGGAALTVGSVISIRNTWKNTKDTRLTRKYLGKLKELN